MSRLNLPELKNPCESCLILAPTITECRDGGVCNKYKIYLTRLNERAITAYGIVDWLKMDMQGCGFSHHRLGMVQRLEQSLKEAGVERIE